MTEKQVLDPCCGSRKFYFDKNSDIVLFGDMRHESYVQCDGRTLTVNPDMQLDVTRMPFGDEVFSLVVFDPPHLKRAGDDSFMRQAYGVLPLDPLEFIRKGFCECWRVLRPHGTLIFKWNTEHIRLADVLAAIPATPLFGNRQPNGKTFWMVFFKAESTSADTFALSFTD